MGERSANESIKGYIYQFDASILQILNLAQIDFSVEIEGIEDVDLHDLTGTTAIQYKYYEGTEYNHSVVGGAIRAMVVDFSTRLKEQSASIRYRLFGHYKAGSEKLSLPIGTEYFKTHFLTFKKDNTQIRLHVSLGLADSDLKNFLDNFEISIKAPSYEDQKLLVVDKLKDHFRCDTTDAELLYYNSALATVATIAASSQGRTIKKSDFIQRIDKKEILLNRWLSTLRGQKQWLSSIRKKIQPGLNLSPFLRFFAIDVKTDSFDCLRVAKLVHKINERWSSKSKRDPNPNCPIFHLHGPTESQLAQIKTILFNDGIQIVDGCPFKGAEFFENLVLVDPPRGPISVLKMVDSLSSFLHIYTSQRRITEFYEVYHGNTFVPSSARVGNYLAIEIGEFNHIEEVFM